MSDEKPVKDDKELKDEELDKVSGGTASGGRAVTGPGHGPETLGVKPDPHGV